MYLSSYCPSENTQFYILSIFDTEITYESDPFLMDSYKNQYEIRNLQIWRVSFSNNPIKVTLICWLFSFVCMIPFFFSKKEILIGYRFQL